MELLLFTAFALLNSVTPSLRPLHRSGAARPALRRFICWQKPPCSFLQNPVDCIIIALGLLYDMEAFFSRHTRLFSSFALPGRSHAVPAVFFDYGIPPHGVAPVRFSCCSSSRKAGCENTAKPRRINPARLCF